MAARVTRHARQPLTAQLQPRPKPRPAAAPPRRPAAAVNPSLAYSDSSHLVLNKPSGVAIQGVHGSAQRSAWDSLLAGKLDKATTGCLLVARTKQVAARLSQQLQQGQIAREYLAVVHGRLKQGYKGTVSNRLRVDDDRVRIAWPDDLDSDTLAASTKWECLATAPQYSLLRLEPLVGARKHQLRVHCADVLKAPIVGDFKLAPDAAHVEALDEVGLPHDSVLLHAASISFWTWDKETRKRHRVTANATAPANFLRFCRAHKLALPAAQPVTPSFPGSESTEALDLE
ncbi:pseudouridine synthase [Rhodotorula sp. JG-1b]|nr:pseudouridine synthase [Rhodotorula sp. JG-1b]